MLHGHLVVAQRLSGHRLAVVATVGRLFSLMLVLHDNTVRVRRVGGMVLVPKIKNLEPRRAPWWNDSLADAQSCWPPSLER